MSNYHRTSARARERERKADLGTERERKAEITQKNTARTAHEKKNAIRDELKTGRGNTYDSNPGLRSDMQIQKSPRINAAKRKEGQQSIRDNGRTTLRDVHEKPIGAPNLRTEKILRKRKVK